MEEDLLCFSPIPSSELYPPEMDLCLFSNEYDFVDSDTLPDLCVSAEKTGDVFISIKKIGSGVYSDVFLGFTVEKQRVFAFKMFNTEADYNTKEDKICVAYMVREITNLKKLKHPHVLKMYDSYITPEGQVFMQMDLYTCSLHDAIELGKITMFDDKKNAAKQMASALAYIHSCGIIHRDLKPANILFRERDKSVHIADFGLSIDVSNINEYTDLDTDVITFPFRPPEVILGDTNYNKTVDVWSLGCIFYTLYTSEQFIATPSREGGKEPRTENLLMDIMRRIGKPSVFDCLHKLPEYYRYKCILETDQRIMQLPFCILDTEITIVMQRMMVYDKDNRISASEVVSILN